jgi:hypothetical protein
LLAGVLEPVAEAAAVEPVLEGAADPETELETPETELETPVVLTPPEAAP